MESAAEAPSRPEAPPVGILEMDAEIEAIVNFKSLTEQQVVRLCTARADPTPTPHGRARRLASKRAPLSRGGAPSGGRFHACAAPGTAPLFPRQAAACAQPAS